MMYLVKKINIQFPYVQFLYMLDIYHKNGVMKVQVVAEPPLGKQEEKGQ